MDKLNLIETNVKLIQDGKNLSILGKSVQVKGGDYDLEDVNRICSILLFRYKIAAAPYEFSRPSIIINEKHNVSDISFSIKKGTLTYSVSFEERQESISLEFKNYAHRSYLGELYRKALIVEVLKSNKYWKFDSPKIFYDKKQFAVGGKDHFNNINDVYVFRRYEISDVILNDGIGICVEIGTAFFTNKPVSYYFENKLAKRFFRLTNRQSGQKGTLLYKKPNGGYSKCYFVKYEPNTTCSTTNPFSYEGEKYNNLYEYYQKKRQNGYEVSKDDHIAYVNFIGIPGEVPVAANKLFIRVMNDMLSFELSQLDKISPQDRNNFLKTFWDQFNSKPFGHDFKGLAYGGKNFIPRKKSGLLDIPDIIFGHQQVLLSPKNKSNSAYKEHFKKRRSYLLRNGCFFSPLTIDRNMYFVFPDTLDTDLVESFADDICELASELTGIEINPIIESYGKYREMINSLIKQDPSTVIFIFDKHEASAYYTIRHELKNWDIKRVTSHELKRKFKQKASRNRWESFVELNTFDVLQQLGCVPWICTELHYDIHLAIDVSEKFTHFCFSFYMFNSAMQKPVIKTDTFTKTNKKEKINQTILENKLNNLFDEWSTELINYSPKKMLVIRDGKICEGELEGLENVIQHQKETGHLCSEFSYDALEYHKSNQKGIRLWKGREHKNNVLEGSYAILSKQEAVLSSTGSATLNQGTAQPTLIKILTQGADIKIILQDLFSMAQLNYSSPTVAQSNCLSIKRADEQLIERKMQEIERIK